MLSRSSPVIAPGGLVLLHLTSVVYPCVRHRERERKTARLCVPAHVWMHVVMYVCVPV